MARRPLLFVAVGLFACLLGSLGFTRWSVDPGTDLLVGRNSDLGQANDRFAQQYGSDPIAVVISSTRPEALYLENNLLRMAKLESDIAANPHVQSVIGPGTVMRSAIESVESQISNTVTGYLSFFQLTELLKDAQDAGGDLTKVTSAQQKMAQTDATRAATALVLELAAAAQKADAARTTYIQAQKVPSDRFLDAEEKAATDAAATVPIPPLLDVYVGGVQKPDAAKARNLFSQFAAAYGDCSSVVTAYSKNPTTCQYFEWRFLLDLPGCPAVSTHQFCLPKAQWAAILPRPQPSGPSYAIMTVRLKPSDAGDPAAVDSVTRQLQSELDSGLPRDSNQTTVRLGAFVPTLCGGVTSSTCTNDERMPYTIGGAPTLTAALSRETRSLLVELVPLVMLAMLVLLVGVFRVRGRLWPLVAAGGATLLTVGLALATGTALTPAVLAGVPVLVGLGVDYAVQLQARFSEERDGGLGVEAALRVTLARSGPATLIAAAATVAGLLALLIVAGIDLGPLTAIPLVAEFAGVLAVGVVLAWLGAVLIALPAAAWAEQRRAPDGPLSSRRRARPGEDEVRDHPPARPVPLIRTLSTRWAVVLTVAVVPALTGWALLSRVPVETDAARLLAADLTELRNVNLIQAQTGAANELDLYVQGDIARDAAARGYQLDLDYLARCRTGGQVATTFAVATLLNQLLDTTGTVSGAGGAAYPCSGGLPTVVTPALSTSPPPTPSPTPFPSGSPSASPSAVAPATTASPAAVRTDGLPAFRSARLAPRADPSATATAPAAATPAVAGTAAPLPAASAAPGVSSGNLSNPLPPAGECALRLFARLSHSLVAGISPPPATNGGQGTEPCPPENVFAPGTALVADPSAGIVVDSTRIPTTITPTTVADQAALIDSLMSQVNALNLPSSIVSVHPAGLVALAAQAYDTLTGRALLLNLLPVLVIAAVLLAIHREPRRALLPVLPTAVAAGWGPLLILLLGRLRGNAGHTLGSLTPLTVVLGALVVALGTEFGVVLLERFHEERGRGLDPDEAAGAALGAVGRAIAISAATLGAGFLVLALSGLVPRGATSRLGFDWHSLPIISAFGLTVLLDLALAVTAVFVVMLPLAVALERRSPLAVATPSRFQRIADRRGVLAAPADAPVREPGSAARVEATVAADEYVVDEEAPVASGAPQGTALGVGFIGLVFAVILALASSRWFLLLLLPVAAGAGAIWWLSRPLEGRPADPGGTAEAEESGLQPAPEDELQLTPEPQPEPQRRPVVAAVTAEPAPLPRLRTPGGGVRRRPPQPAPAPMPAAPPAAGAPAAPRSGRLPGMSGRRRPAVQAIPPSLSPDAPRAAAEAPQTAAEAPRPRRSPSLSGRPRSTVGGGAAPPAPAPPASAAAPTVRRRPGGVVGRRPAPPAGQTAAAAPAVPPRAPGTGPVPPVASAAPPGPGAGPAEPAASAAPRHRRRRPPPHVRRQLQQSDDDEVSPPR